MRRTGRLTGRLIAAATMTIGFAIAQQARMDRDAILRELDKLEASHRDRVATEQKTVGESLKLALTNPRTLIDFYEEAVFATRFDGAKKDSAEFRKWKTAQQATHKDEDFQAALSAHANYLNLTLIRASAPEPVKLNEALVQHVRRVWTLEEKYDLGKKTCAELLRRPVNQGVLAQRFGLAQRLGGPQGDGKVPDRDKNWEWNPGNTDGMLDKTLFPFLRSMRSPSLIVLWDERIANEAARAKRAGLSDRAAQFSQQTLPRLLWRRARDLVLLDRRDEGCLAMLDILRQNVNHADFEANVKELRDLLSGGTVTHSDAAE